MSALSALLAYDDAAVRAWTHELDAAAAAVLPEYTTDERALLETIPIRALVVDRGLTSPQGHPFWAAYTDETGPPRIEVYRPFFADDPDARALQLQDILRHEYAHVLGTDMPEEYAPREPPPLMPDGWYSTRSIVVTEDGLTVAMPGLP